MALDIEPEVCKDGAMTTTSELHVPPREADPIPAGTVCMSELTKAQLCDLLDEYRRDRVRDAEYIEELEANVKRLTKLVRKVYNTTTDAALVRSLGQSLKSQPL